MRKIQQRLDDLDYPVGEVDGVYGEDTQLAINLFCDAIHVREHNYITPKVQKRLFAKNAPEYDPYLPLKKGDQGVSVWYMQRQLKVIGYDPGFIDGIYGKNTVKAVAAFQKDNKIKRKKNEKPGEVASREMLKILFGDGPWPFETDDPVFFHTPEPPAPPPGPATQTDLKPEILTPCRSERSGSFPSDGNRGPRREGTKEKQRRPAGSRGQDRGMLI